MNLLSGFLDNAAVWSSRTAIVEGGGARISYGALAQRSAELAGAWRAAGVGPGDRVLIAMPIGVDLYAGIAALWRIGATIVFPEPALGLAGLKHAARVTQPKAILTSGLYRLLPFAAERAVSHSAALAARGRARRGETSIRRSRIIRR
jgi:acyl-coenzyme A synthetase/AMP-(fatty) acid ligase